MKKKTVLPLCAREEERPNAITVEPSKDMGDWEIREARDLAVSPIADEIQHLQWVPTQRY